MERKHKRDGHTCTKGEKNTAAMGENGETIKIGTVVQHPFARPPHFFFFFTVCPMRIPVGLQEMMPWSTKKRRRGKQSSIWHIRKQQKVLFQQNAGFREKGTHSRLQTVWLSREVSKMRCVQSSFFFSLGNGYKRKKKVKIRRKLASTVH